MGRTGAALRHPFLGILKRTQWCLTQAVGRTVLSGGVAKWRSQLGVVLQTISGTVGKAQVRLLTK